MRSSSQQSSSSNHYTANYVWNVKDVLGHGATCEVYKAYNKTTGTPVAVKVFNRGGYSRAMYQQQRELQLVKELKHTNLVKVLNIEEDEVSRGKSVVVMELCEGKSLFSFLSIPQNRNGLSDAEFLVVLHDVTEGVKYLREKSVVHRDIKPGNIMRCIKEDGSSLYKLTDFGGARELDDNEVFMSLHGTEEYLHPAMYEKALIDKRSPGTFKAEVDLWSLGATFYHCVAGETPFRPYNGRQNKEVMLEMTKNKEPGVISGVQKEPNGPITYSKKLPTKSPVSPFLKGLLEPLLGKLMEKNETNSFTFQEYFDTVDDITSRRQMELLDTESCSLYKLYLERSCTTESLQEIVETWTRIKPSEQIYFSDKHIGLAEVVKNLNKTNHLYVTSHDNNFVTEYRAVVNETKFSKPSSSDTLTADYSLSYAICVEAFSHVRELERCVRHCRATHRAMVAITDFCKNNPARLRAEMTGLHGRLGNLEARRNDILATNSTFIAVINLLGHVFNSVEVDQEGHERRQVYRHPLIDEPGFAKDLAESLGLNPDHYTAVDQILQNTGAREAVKALAMRPANASTEMYLSLLAESSPLLHLLAVLSQSQQTLSLWAEQKERSGSNVDEQLQVLMTKIREIEEEGEKEAEETLRMEELIKELEVSEKSMNTTLDKMVQIQQEFESHKKSKITVNVSVNLNHKLKRNYLTTLKKRARELTLEAVEKCKEANKCLVPKVKRFLVLEETLRKYELEYKHDLDMFSQHELNMGQWRTLVFETMEKLVETARNIAVTPTAVAVGGNNAVRNQIMATIDRFKKENEENRKLCNENAAMCRKILELLIADEDINGDR